MTEQRSLYDNENVVPLLYLCLYLSFTVVVGGTLNIPFLRLVNYVWRSNERLQLELNPDCKYRQNNDVNLEGLHRGFSLILIIDTSNESKSN